MAELKNWIFDTLKNKRRAMSPKQRARNNTVKFKVKYLPPAGLERGYFFFIRGIMKQFTELADGLIEPYVKLWVEEWSRVDSSYDDWKRNTEALRNKQQEFFKEGRNSQSLLSTIIGFGQDTSNYNQDQMNKFIKLLIDEPVFPYEPWLDDVLRDWGDTNLQLIQGMSDDYIRSINNTVYDVVRNGGGYKEVMASLRKLDQNITNYRAKLIAVDQIGKLNGYLTKRRNEEAGLNLYTWSSSRDERVRPSHKTMEGRLCRWDNPDVYSNDEGKTWIDRGSGVHLHPGIDIRCRCGSIPYFDELLTAVDTQLAKEEGTPAPVSPTPKPPTAKKTSG